ncbi:fibrocystin-like isoform X4 [Scylla paramamosain]
MYPPALKQKGILIEDVAVKKVTENGYSLEFQTTNCKTGMPLLGLLQVEGPPASFDTQVTVTCSSQTATGPLAGTWDLGIQGQVVKDIPAGVDPKVLEGILESALGTDLTVQYSGSCKNYHYYIEWEEDPGRKELVEIHTDNLMFDGTLKTKIIRDSAGVLWHSPLETDFVTTHRDSPHVTVQVNGYFGACLGACAFTYDDATTPMLTGVSGTAGEGLQHTLTLSGTAITATQLTCTVALWGGLHSVALSMQPAGSALLPSPIIYMVPVTVVALSITEGSTGGQYPLTVTGTGFPDSDGWEAGSAIMTLGGKKCVVISGGPTKVTCTVPAGEGTVDVVVDVGGTSGSLPSSFTYDVSLSPTIIVLSLHTLSLFGQEEQTLALQDQFISDQSCVIRLIGVTSA